MKIRMLAHTADENGAYRPQDEPDLKDEVALDYIARGLAIRIDASPVETATVVQPEVAAARRGRPPTEAKG